MHIQLRIESHYGTERKYVVDPTIARAIETLTRKRTIDDADITALVVLGHTVSESEVLGRKVG